MRNDLVEYVKGDSFTNSVLVAQKLEVPHKVLMQTIEKVLGKECHGYDNVFKQKFIISEFTTKMNRTYPMYLMNEPAFSKLVMNLSGYKNAEIVQDIFIEAFFKMKEVIKNHQNVSWIGSREQGKLARKEEMDVVKQLVDYAVENGSVNASMYYRNITNMTNKALELLIQVKDDKPIREMASAVELGFISVVDNRARQAIADGLSRKLPYKEIYRYAKEEVNKLVDSLDFKPKLS